MCFYIINIFDGRFAEDFDSETNYKKIYYRKVMKSKWCHNMQFWLRNVKKSQRRKMLIFWSLQLIVDGFRSGSAAAYCCS